MLGSVIAHIDCCQGRPHGWHAAVSVGRHDRRPGRDRQPGGPALLRRDAAAGAFGDADDPAAFAAQEAERYFGRRVNHGFEKLEMLPGQVGYLSLRVFAPPAMAGDVAAAAMTVLAQADALVIDLRRNGGGDADMVVLFAAYLLPAASR